MKAQEMTEWLLDNGVQIVEGDEPGRQSKLDKFGSKRLPLHQLKAAIALTLLKQRPPASNSTGDETSSCLAANNPSASESVDQAPRGSSRPAPKQRASASKSTADETISGLAANNPSATESVEQAPRGSSRPAPKQRASASDYAADETSSDFEIVSQENVDDYFGDSGLLEVYFFLQNVCVRKN